MGSENIAGEGRDPLLTVSQLVRPFVLPGLGVTPTQGCTHTALATGDTRRAGGSTVGTPGDNGGGSWGFSARRAHTAGGADPAGRPVSGGEGGNLLRRGRAGSQACRGGTPSVRGVRGPWLSLGKRGGRGTLRPRGPEAARCRGPAEAGGKVGRAPGAARGNRPPGKRPLRGRLWAPSRAEACPAAGTNGLGRLEQPKNRFPCLLSVSKVPCSYDM